MKIEINNSIVENPLKDKKQWLLWKAKPKNGSEKFDKIPYYATNLKLRKGVQGSEEDVKNLVDFETAYRFASENPEFGLGFALLPNDNIVGVDFDNCIVDGVINDDIQMAMDLLGGYWEVSPSGRGVRGLFKGKTKTIRTKKVEIYSGVQFLTITGNVVPGAEFKLVGFNEDTLGHLYDIGVDSSEELDDLDVATHQTIPFNSADGDLAREALSYIDADCSYSEWMSVACAMKYRFGDDPDGMAAFVEWSSKGSKFISEADCIAQYERMDAVRSGENITFGTLLNLARVGGMPEAQKKATKDKTKIRGADEQYLQNALVKNDKGAVIKNNHNVRLILMHSDKLPRLTYDVATKKMYWSEKPSWDSYGEIDIGGLKYYEANIDKEWGEVDEIMYINYGLAATKDMIQNMMIVASFKTKIDIFIDVFNHKVPKWDGVNRIDTWLTEYLGIEDNAYTRAVGEKFLCSGIRRMFHPGGAVHASLIFEGVQGFGKSSLVEYLSLGLFEDQDIDVKNKDSLMVAQKCWILELAELTGLTRSEAEDMKSFMSRSSDTFRAPFGKVVETYPRRFIMIGTTNDSSYLKDQTGNRRYWPVKIDGAKLDHDKMKADVAQLWAEAKIRHYEKYPNVSVDIYLDGEAKAIAMRQQEKRVISNPLIDTIINFIITKKHKSFLENSCEFEEVTGKTPEEDLIQIDEVTIRDISSVDNIAKDKTIKPINLAYALNSLEGVEKVGRRRVKRFGGSLETLYKVDLVKFNAKYGVED